MSSIPSKSRKCNGMISTEVVQVIPVGRRKAGISNNHLLLGIFGQGSWCGYTQTRQVSNSHENGTKLVLMCLRYYILRSVILCCAQRGYIKIARANFQKPIITCIFCKDVTPGFFRCSVVHFRSWNFIRFVSFSVFGGSSEVTIVLIKIRLSLYFLLKMTSQSIPV